MTKARKAKPSEQTQQSQTSNHRRTIPDLLLELVDKCEVWSKETRSKLWGKTPSHDPAGENDDEDGVDLWHTFLEATSEPWTEAHERLFCEHPGAAKELQSRYMDVVNFLQDPPYSSDPPQNIATLAIIPLSGLTSLSRNVAKELEAQATRGAPKQAGETAGGATNNGTETKAIIKNRFTFNPGQVLFDQEDLGLPSGEPIEMLQKLVERFGVVVPYVDFDRHYTSGTPGTVHKSKREIVKVLEKNKVPCKVISKTGAGYLIQGCKSAIKRKNQVRKK